MNCQDLLITWLNNAYSMEQSIVQILEEHAEDTNGLPELRKKIEDQIELREDKADRIRAEIERLGGEITESKISFSGILGSLSSLPAESAQDKTIKNAIADHAIEHYEMAVFLVIKKAADFCGEEETAQLAGKIMKEEMVSGEELEDQIGMIVGHYIDLNIDEG